MGGHRDEVLAGFTARLVPWTWHATAARRYRPLPEIAALALRSAAAESGVELSADEADEVAKGLTELPPLPGVAEGLEELDRDGHRMAVLSNGTGDGVQGAGRGRRARRAVRAPARRRRGRRVQARPRGLRHGRAAPSTVPRRDVLLVSAHAWDVAGARQHGLRGAWLHRGSTLAPVLGEEPDLVAADVSGLPRALREAAPRRPSARS
ncbi:MAG: hypothetical protein WKF31_11275 [Thermoleophilaceae bacterium]